VRTPLTERDCPGAEGAIYGLNKAGQIGRRIGWLVGMPLEVRQRADYFANTSPAISAAASSCIAGMACE
jgi:hypothetical protein